MNEHLILSRLEHNLLSMIAFDEEPLFVLYRDTMRDIEGATLDLIVQTLVKFVRMGFIKCYFITNGHLYVKSERKPIDEPTVDELKRHASAYSEEDLRYYPSHGDYYFQITEKGEAEEAKDIYDIYYPESEE